MTSGKTNKKSNVSNKDKLKGVKHKGASKFKSKSPNGKSQDEKSTRPKGRGNPPLRTPVWQESRMVPFKRDFYAESTCLVERSDEEVLKFREAHKITVTGSDIPKPIQEFSDYDFPDFLQKEIIKQGYDSPRPVQSQGWPIALSARDLVGIAETGSGKTLGYVLPAIVHIKNQPPLRLGDGPLVLIVAPTRELAQQIHSVVVKFGASSKVRSVCLYGGTCKESQIKALKKGVEICISTPGRLMGLLASGKTNLRRCTYLVLDEADRMLDMGFEPKIRKIILQIRPDRQILMFSATWPPQINSLANEFLKNYIYLNIGSEKLATNDNISQFVQICEDNQKSEKLFELLRSLVQEQMERTIIFCQTKKDTSETAKLLRKSKWSVVCIHGDKSQEDRDSALKKFKAGTSKILVATDVASRGLDISEVKYVINYDFPRRLEDYVHRIGRTGRSDTRGTAYTFLTRREARFAKGLISLLKESRQEISPDLETLASEYNSRVKECDGDNDETVIE